MSEMRAYPEAEHYDFPADVVSVIHDEIRFTPDAQNFRLNLMGLGRLYDKTEVVADLRRSARLMRIAQAAGGWEEDENPIDNDFYVGELLALHGILRSCNSTARNFLYHYGVHHIDPRSLDEAYLKELLEYRENTWERSFIDQDEDLQEAILTAALHAYGDIPNSANRESGFAAGFMYAAAIITVRLGIASE